MNKDRYFRTNSLNIAIFLFAKGLELVNLNKDNPKKCEFVFINTPEIERLIYLYNYAKDGDSEVLIDVRRVFSSTRTLKDKLYQNND